MSPLHFCCLIICAAVKKPWKNLQKSAHLSYCCQVEAKTPVTPVRTEESVTHLAHLTCHQPDTRRATRHGALTQTTIPSCNTNALRHHWLRWAAFPPIHLWPLGSLWGWWFIIHRRSQTCSQRQPQAERGGWGCEDEPSLFIMHRISDCKTVKANPGPATVLRAVNLGCSLSRVCTHCESRLAEYTECKIIEWIPMRSRLRLLFA